MNPSVVDRMRKMLRKKATATSSTTNVARTRHELSTVENKLDKAMELFVQLRDTLQRADTVHLRELLSRAIEKVEVWSVPVPQSPRRHTYYLQRGVIYLRSDQFENLSQSS